MTEQPREQTLDEIIIEGAQYDATRPSTILGGKTMAQFINNARRKVRKEWEEDCAPDAWTLDCYTMRITAEAIPELMDGMVAKRKELFRRGIGLDSLSVQTLMGHFMGEILEAMKHELEGMSLDAHYGTEARFN